MRIKESGINYMGNKTKLIQKHLCNMFPSDINTFYDLFGGSGVVSLNVKANKYVLNDYDPNTYMMYVEFSKIKDWRKLDKDIIEIIRKYGLPLKSTSKNAIDFDEVENEMYKTRYNDLRDSYNKTKDFIKLLVLQRYSMSNIIRFNSSGMFNMPKGNQYYISKEHAIQHKNSIDFFNKDNVTVKNKSYLEFTNFEENDFVYLDPPYINTTATYNENGAWCEKDEDDLFEYLITLNEKGVKFALSNTYVNKGVENTRLKYFVKENCLYDYTFKDFTYVSFGKGNSETQEVLIANYPLRHPHGEQVSLFD